MRRNFADGIKNSFKEKERKTPQLLQLPDLNMEEHKTKKVTSLSMKTWFAKFQCEHRNKDNKNHKQETKAPFLYLQANNKGTMLCRSYAVETMGFYDGKLSKKKKPPTMVLFSYPTTSESRQPMRRSVE